METFIVIPCLNEAGCIEATCKSLSFGDGAEPCGRLVLVDNGSSDATLQVLAAIQRASPPGRVLVTRELQRGYVSARRAGMAAILAQAQHEQLRDDLVLVLQADADTIYLPGYISTMQDAHSGVRGQLLEGNAVTSRDFNLEFPAFAKLCREVDSEMEHWFAPEKDQVVADDQAAQHQGRLQLPQPVVEQLGERVASANDIASGRPDRVGRKAGEQSLGVVCVERVEVLFDNLASIRHRRTVASTGRTLS